jgi:hypothetical protein
MVQRHAENNELRMFLILIGVFDGQDSERERGGEES